MAVPTIALQNGSMPVIGLGTWKLQGDACENLVYEAIKNGVRHIDTACDYANEEQVGKGVQRAIDEGIVTRADLFITSKLWCTYKRKENVGKALAKTLGDLQLSYVDLYLIHFPISLEYVPFEDRYPPEWWTMTEAGPAVVLDRVPLSETWGAMEALVNEGKAKNIGVSNFSVQLLNDLLSYATIKPSVNQIELHPKLQQATLVKYCAERGVAVTAYSPLGVESYMIFGVHAPTQSVFQNEAILKIATKHGKTAAQVILRWGVQRGYSIIPKCSNVERIKENFNIFDFVLDEEDLAAMATLEEKKRYNDPGLYLQFDFGCYSPIFDY